MRKSLRAKYKKARIERKRQERKLQDSYQYSYDKAFTFRHFVVSLKKCMCGVRWKGSAQRYYLNCIAKLYKDFTVLSARRLPRFSSGKEIGICERGKKRIITPIHIKDRIIQKVLCDHILVPVLSKKLIYDNGACIKGKGVSFSRRRVKEHLLKAIREYGTDFYVLCFDFKDFFNSVPHKTCREVLEKYLAEEDAVDITMRIINQPYAAMKRETDRGMTLGSQVSQIMALIIANSLDHLLKDVLRVKHYLRHMDDGILFARTKDELLEILKKISAHCGKIGLVINQRKTKIVKASHGFTFLKIKYNILKSGKILRRLAHVGIVRMRRKYKKLLKKHISGELPYRCVYDSVQSWMSHTRLAQAYRTTKQMIALTGDVGRKRREEENVLQTHIREKYIWSCLQPGFPQV